MDEPPRPPGLPPPSPIPGDGMPRVPPADIPGAGPPGIPPPGVEAGPPSRGKALAIGVALALVAAGAITGVLVARSGGRKPVSAAPAVLKAGWTSQVVKGEGFSVGLPPKWTSVPTTTADDALNALRSANPDLAKLVGDQLGGSLSSLMKLLAFDGGSSTLAEDFATNVNIVVAPVPSSVGLDGFVEENLSQLRRVPNVSGIQSRRVTLPAGESALIHSELTVNTQKGQQKASISQYLLLGSDKGYILSFSTLPSALGSYEALFDEIARTFRLL